MCINHYWPQKLTLADQGRRIHPEISYKPHLQETEKTNRWEGMFNAFLRWNNKEMVPNAITPSKQHNHRAISNFQTVVRASRTGVNRFNISQLSQGCKADRTALEKFFQDTHHCESDWSNKVTGSGGRLHWLNKQRHICDWQGVTVYGEDGGEYKGRLLKLQLSKNNISGLLFVSV